MEYSLYKGFTGADFSASNGVTLPYRLFVPTLEPGRKYPLILQFHGIGSWGTENRLPLNQAARMVKPDYPALILAPQTPEQAQWVDVNLFTAEHVRPAQPAPTLYAAMELLKHVMNGHDGIVDRRRIYTAGQSMGGYAVWDAVSRWPQFFAAAVPVCGGGDPAVMAELRDLPIWAFHGALDTVVPTANSRILVEALKRAGSTCVRYTEYPDVEHNAWVRAFDDPEMYRWLFSQSRQSLPAI